MVESASNLLVVGSSLATFSAFRLIAAYRAAKKGKGEVGLLNVGESRGDGHVDWRIGKEKLVYSMWANRGGWTCRLEDRMGRRCRGGIT